MNFDLPSLLFLSIIAMISLVLTWFVRNNSAKLRLVQVPNQRSSHTLPTPSGGGVAVAVASLCSAIVFLPTNQYALLATFVSAAAAVLGFLDDRYDLPAASRFAAHLAFSAGLVLFALGSSGNWSVAYIAFFAMLTIAGAWWINLFNFMDGIDGLAASQSIFMLLAAVSLAVLGSGDAAIGDWMSWWSVAISAAVLGFLVLNWPPAKIFMGDAGSIFLATAIFSIFLWFEVSDFVGAPALLLIVGLFVSDATVTLLRRLISGQKWWSAHREHAYQRLSSAWSGHLPVTLTYLAISVLWLYPCAYFAETMPDISWLIVAAGYLPVVTFVLLGDVVARFGQKLTSIK